MRKRIYLFIFIICILLIVGCQKTEQKSTSHFNEFAGDWIVGAIYYENYLVDIHEIESIEDMYDTVFLTINEDGTFTYLNKIFYYEGKCVLQEPDTEEKGRILLETEASGRYTLEDSQFKKIENTSDNKTNFLITLLDENTFTFSKYDVTTGKDNASEQPLIFVRKDSDSKYIADNKISFANDSASVTENITDNDSSHQNNSTTQKQDNSFTHNSYEDIYSTYVKKMEKAVSGLVREYNAESSGISDIEELAEICNDKIEKLAEICNDGMVEMASLMQENGDSYNTYETWATKLQEEYMDIATDIQDAYLDSAMYSY